ncbi:vomeronasal type-1 receptor 90-like, partial [Marmota monax]|uniref:vomeronasal type-1 receptor 90-like n=1 Tax=Marmota monax TaxID=9995 RepID=UPI001EB0080C
MTKSSTLSIYLAVRNVFSSQIVLGVTANVFLLLFYIFMFLVQGRTRPTDMAIAHLGLIHLLMLIIRVFLDIDILGVQDIWNDITCKAIIYLYRLMRSLSVSTTCQLSVLQATTLSPRSSSTCPHSRVCGILWDIFLLGLMALSSGYMVALLWRHKRQCQHLHTTSRIPQASPEQRATRTILLLMGSFVVMYYLDCVISSSYGKMQKEDLVRLVFQMLVGNGYTTVSALMLISTGKTNNPLLPIHTREDEDMFMHDQITSHCVITRYFHLSFQKLVDVGKNKNLKEDEGDETCVVLCKIFITP